MTSFYSRYWPYVNAGYMLIKGRLGGRPFPWYVNYFITSKCNLNCSYCYVDINAGPEKDPSLEQIRHTIDALYRLGTRYVCLLGGEPLLHPKFEEIVDYLLAKGMLVSVNTNGTIIGRQDHVLRKIHRVAVSFEGTSEANDKDRGRGTYDKIVLPGSSTERISGRSLRRVGSPPDRCTEKAPSFFACRQTSAYSLMLMRWRDLSRILFA